MAAAAAAAAAAGTARQRRRRRAPPLAGGPRAKKAPAVKPRADDGAGESNGEQAGGGAPLSAGDASEDSDDVPDDDDGGHARAEPSADGEELLGDSCDEGDGDDDGEVDDDEGDGDADGQVDDDDDDDVDEAEVAAYLNMQQEKNAAAAKEAAGPGGSKGQQQERRVINDKKAILALIDEIKYPDSMPWEELMDVTTDEPVNVPDVNNDLERELAIYTQAKSSVLVGRRLLLKAGIPFSRPDDYFAETVKSDSHMFKVRQKMADELGALKAADEARRQRELRKFGKKVEMEKLAERKKKKALEEEKIRAFKKKRKGADLDTANAVGDEFDVALETNDSPRPGKRQKAEQKDKKAHTPNAKRRGKNAKYGFGGKKRGSKSNTAESSANFKGFSLAKNNSTSFGRQGK